MRPLALTLALLLTSCGGAASPGADRGAAPEPIAWQPFGPEAFERARREDRMVLVDVGIEGCTACRWMYEDTYRHPEVVRRIQERFVAVAVDADVRPDLGERWEPWGWPATIVLTADGAQVFAVRGNKRPRNFIPILDELIRRHAAGSLEAEAGDAPAAPPPEPRPLDALCSTAVQRVGASADREHGGFGRRMHGAHGGPVRWAFFRDRARGEPALREHALATLEGYRRMIDPVWGGIFVAASADFSSVIPEKRTIHQGPVLAAFAEAYHLTGDARWRDAALDIDRYLREWMRAPDGTFYATQEDAAPGLPPGMDARAYYALGDEERRRHGIPPIDHAVYTDLNAGVIEAYATLYRATGESAHLEMATRAADVLLRERQQPEGWIAQTTPNDALAGDARMRAFEAPAVPFLEPQGPMGLALLALHSVTGEARWLEAAQGIARGLDRLEDPERGGFFASDEPETARLLGRRRPYHQNVEAARFLVRLSWVAHDEALGERAERTLRAIGAEAELAQLGSAAHGLARAVEELRYGPLELTVVGDRTDPRARALFEASVRSYAPRGIVQYEAPGGRYPDAGEPVVYVCTPESCSSPLSDPELVPTASVRMERMVDPEACAGPG